MRYEEVKQKYAGAVAEKKKKLERIDSSIKSKTLMLESLRNAIRDYGIIVNPNDQPGLDYAKKKVSSLQKQIEDLKSERFAIMNSESDKQNVFKLMKL